MIELLYKYVLYTKLENKGSPLAFTVKVQPAIIVRESNTQLISYSLDMCGT